MAEYKNYLLKRFKFVSKIYDLLMVPTSRLREEVLNSYNFNPDTKVLEVGTGTGNLAIDISRISKKVFAGDISIDMLKKGKTKNSEVKFLLFDGTKLPFKDKEFDISITATVLHETPVDVIENILKEMNRVTKDSIIIVDYSTGNLFSKIILKTIVSIYESRYYRDYISLNMNTLFDKLNLKLTLEKQFLNIFKIWKIKCL